MQSIDKSYLQHWLPPRRTRRLCNCAATPRPRKCVAPDRSRACATIDLWLGSLEEEVNIVERRTREDKVTANRIRDPLVRASERARSAIDSATRTSTCWPTHLLIYYALRSPKEKGRPGIASRKDSLDTVACSPRNSWQSVAVVAWTPVPEYQVALQ